MREFSLVHECRAFGMRLPVTAVCVFRLFNLRDEEILSMSGEAILQLIRREIESYEVTAFIREEMAQQVTAPPPPSVPERKALAKAFVTPAKRAELRAQRRSRKRLLLLPLLLLAGCSSYSWSHPQLDQARYKRDHYECDRDSTTYGGGSGLAGALMIAAAQNRADRLYAICMEARGYSKVTD